MQFKSKTEKEINDENLWPAGNYAFQIAKAEDALSKSARERGESEPNMIKLTLNIYNDDGRCMVAFDYLMEAMLYKLLHCAQACELEGKYNAGVLDAIDFEGKTGTLKLVVQKGNDQYPNDKNSVSDYVVKKEAPALAEVISDDIPY